MHDGFAHAAEYCVTIPGCEEPTFCFRCGSTALVPRAGYGVRGWRCTKCAYGGDRFYAACPDAGCGGAFCHLHSPTRIEFSPDKGSVAEAEGIAWCDACGHFFVYRWFNPPDGEAQLALAGWAGPRAREAATATGRAVDLIVTGR